MIIKKKIISLLEKSMRHYDEYKSKKFIVSPSIPILYFGDIEEYASSKIKIVTVALNPSSLEFKQHKDEVHSSFFRFSDWEKTKNHYSALNKYFKKDSNPLDWFNNSFEPLLNGLNASYFSDKNYENRVLHTDLCSPLATEKGWTDFSKEKPTEAKKLMAFGKDLWRELINILEPDIILVSVRDEYKTKVFGSSFRIYWDTKQNAEMNCHQDLKGNNLPRKAPYQVFIKEEILESGKSVKIIYGKANQYPFMDLDFVSIRKPRVKLGEYILTDYLNNNIK